MSRYNIQNGQLPKEVIEELNQNRKMRAIKILCEKTTLSLKEAKSLVNAYSRQNKYDYETPRDQGTFLLGRLIIIFMVLTIFGAGVYLWMINQ